MILPWLFRPPVRFSGRSSGSDWLPPQIRDTLDPDYEPQTVNRRALKARAGRVTIPYLVDPNTATELAESERILEYLEATYAA